MPSADHGADSAAEIAATGGALRLADAVSEALPSRAAVLPRPAGYRGATRSGGPDPARTGGSCLLARGAPQEIATRCSSAAHGHQPRRQRPGQAGRPDQGSRPRPTRSATARLRAASFRPTGALRGITYPVRPCVPPRMRRMAHAPARAGTMATGHAAPRPDRWGRPPSQVRGRAMVVRQPVRHQDRPQRSPAVPPHPLVLRVATGMLACLTVGALLGLAALVLPPPPAARPTAADRSAGSTPGPTSSSPAAAPPPSRRRSRPIWSSTGRGSRPATGPRWRGASPTCAARRRRSACTRAPSSRTASGAPPGWWGSTSAGRCTGSRSSRSPPRRASTSSAWPTAGSSSTGPGDPWPTPPGRCRPPPRGPGRPTRPSRSPG
jgi:hypothetical protein